MSAHADPRGSVIEFGPFRLDVSRRVWPETFVEEANLTVHVSALRKALGSQPDGRPWIDTVPRRGYRFVGPPPRRTAAGPRSLAVLPFAALADGR